MKKILLLCLLATLSIMGYAQDTKKVAILEVVDKEGKLSYSQKLMRRSNLARAITNTSGYEAYDRSDIDEIFKEHSCQRTGNVSAKQIKKLGESYLCPRSVDGKNIADYTAEEIKSSIAEFIKK